MATQAVCSVMGCDKPIHVTSRGWCRAHYLRWTRHGDPEAGGRMQAAAGEAVKFLEEQAVTHAGNDCLTWPFARSRGSAMIYIDGRNARAARIICERVHGPPPSADHEAAHSCGGDHLGCVNPRHLRWATGAENNQDKLAHGTHNRGERHNLSRLTEGDVRAIRASRGAESQRALAKRHGVSISTIKDIHAGRTWGWLT